MGNFIVNRPFIYIAGNIIDPNQNNPNETTIYSGHNLSMNAAIGHGHTGAVGDGPKLTSTGLDLTANYAWTGNHSFSAAGTFSLNNGAAFSGTITGTPTFSGDITFGGKIKFDANNYFNLSAPNQISITAGGVSGTSINGTTLTTSLDVSLSSPAKLKFDANTYLNLAGAGQLAITAGGVSGTSINSTDITTSLNLNLVTGKKLTLDNGTNYWINSGVGQNDLYSNNILALRTRTDGGVYFPVFIGMNGSPIYLDNFQNDYFQNTANGVNKLVANGIDSITTNANGEILLVDVSSPTANYIGRRAPSRAWGQVQSDGTNGGIVYNASTVRNGLGDYTVTFTTHFAAGNFAMIVTPQAHDIQCQVQAKTSSTAHLLFRTISTDAAVDSAFDFVAFGIQ